MLRRNSFALGLLVVAACSGETAKEGATATSSVSVPYWTYSTKVEEARQHVQAGERLFDTGYDLKANDEFKRAVAADSSFAYAYLRVAETSRDPAAYATNLKRAEARIALANPVEQALIQSALLYANNDVQGAMAQWTKATELEPKNARGWMQLGLQLGGVNKTTESRAAFEKAIALDSLYALPLFNLAESYLFREPKDMVKAERYVLAGQKLWPNEPLSFDRLGRLRRAQNRLDDAIVAYSEEIKRDPTYANSYQVRGNANVFAGHFDAARADYDAGFRVAKPAERANAAHLRTWVDGYEGNVDGTLKAQSELVKAIDGLGVPAPRQDKANVRYSQAMIAILQRRLAVADTAVKDYALQQLGEAKAQNSPGLVRFYEAEVAFLEGMLAAFRGDFAVAKGRADDIERMRKADNGPDKDYEVHGLRGITAVLEKNYAFADNELRTADPSNSTWELAYYRGVALEGLGRAAEAKAQFQRVATNNFNSPQFMAVRRDAIAKFKSMK